MVTQLKSAGIALLCFVLVMMKIDVLVEHPKTTMIVVGIGILLVLCLIFECCLTVSKAFEGMGIQSEIQYKEEE